ncbi:DUF2842 domain-containing protein [Polymorphobacter fuscus]|uniref:DUF2842 domain-containing protein n=1 Tax=Sandarakinorhabdus fusca TaxID=1439888 RepID=A0A7C9GMZ5_9SPHN|nr:DUF2842 domain-containing protein [Polymorphobacter fuscus]KAB7648747.1 DUF2842 domain-containing protein [Polymorphobacter fuscus]MQT16315.1 DUF2842 domain-containing protein [Polymorphobacter fuscus]NJC07398.1 hypothetical protein [Polymorphobacter fuscus]
MALSPPPEPSWRKPVGMLGLLGYLALYALVVTSFADALATLPQPLVVLAYIAAGLAWVLPLRPLFLWMNTGRWTHDGEAK